MSPAPDLLAVEDLLALDHAEAEAGQVVLARMVEVGQDRRLAAEQGAFGLDAAVADPLHDLLGQGGVVAAHRDVVEEQERLGPGAEAVVDRHRDQVDADGRVPAGGEGELELGADAVGRGDQDRVAIGPAEQADVGVEPEEAGEPARPLDHPRGVGALEQPGQEGHRLLVGVEVDAGGLVIDRLGHGRPRGWGIFDGAGLAGDSRASVPQGSNFAKRSIAIENPSRPPRRLIAIQLRHYVGRCQGLALTPLS